MILDIRALACVPEELHRSQAEGRVVTARPLKQCPFLRLERLAAVALDLTRLRP